MCYNSVLQYLCFVVVLGVQFCKMVDGNLLDFFRENPRDKENYTTNPYVLFCVWVCGWGGDGGDNLNYFATTKF